MTRYINSKALQLIGGCYILISGTKRDEKPGNPGPPTNSRRGQRSHRKPAAMRSGQIAINLQHEENRYQNSLQQRLSSIAKIAG